MRCGKQGGQTFEGADRYWERDAKTAEESTRSAAESVHETPINNDTSNFTKDDGFLHGKRKREGVIKGRVRWMGVHRRNRTGHDGEKCLGVFSNPRKGRLG